MFSPANALDVSDYSKHVQKTSEQHKLDVSSRSRTSVLPWRGQFSPDFIKYLLDEDGQTAETVLDPFCGSGTLSYEAASRRKNCYVFDINPAAICLAKTAYACALNASERWDVIQDLKKLSYRFIERIQQKKSVISASQIVEITRNHLEDHKIQNELLESFLLFLFGNNSEIDEKKIAKGIDSFAKIIFSIPHFHGELKIFRGDARSINIRDEIIDLIITSPPYINVINYHQHYRPITEALGYKPLEASKAEIGANRKFRQNRFMTVIQYCMDMALFLVEAARVLSKNGKMIIILGRESTVQGVSFKNGELFAAIASEGMGWGIKKWNERVFLNRFGEKITEDVITLTANIFSASSAAIIGNQIGCEALCRAMSSSPPEQCIEINRALQVSETIKPSALLEMQDD